MVQIADKGCIHYPLGVKPKDQNQNKQDRDYI